MDEKHGNGYSQLMDMLKSPQSNNSDSVNIKKLGLSAQELEEKWKTESDQKKQKEETEKLNLELKQKEEAILIEEEKNLLRTHIEEMREKIEIKYKLRCANLSVSEPRQDEAIYSKLDSNLKKNTAFVKKLKNITENQRDTLIKDFKTLNLSKYVGEMASAISEAKLKMSDVNCALQLCSLMHQRYAEFSSQLLESLQKVLLSKKHDKEDKPINMSKLRVDLRFFADLIAVGLFSQKEALVVLANQLTLLINGDKEEHNNLTIILSFCKHCGDDYGGLIQRKYRSLAEKYEEKIPRSDLLPAERQKACKNLLKDYFNSVCKHVTKMHKELRKMEQKNRHIIHNKGELPNDRKEHTEALQQNFTKLFNNACTFADIMDEDPPVLPEIKLCTDNEMAVFDMFSHKSSEYEGESCLFEDEESRVFYENLSDLRAIIPGILYKDSEQGSSVPDPEKIEKLNAELENVNEEEIEKELMQSPDDQSAVTDSSAAPPVSADSPSANKSTATVKEQMLDNDEIPPDLATDYAEVFPRSSRHDDSEIAHSIKQLLDCFLLNLPNCVNRDLIDRAAIEFCTSFNTKVNRRKLVRALVTVHRTRYDILPFYSRLVATLHPCMPDVSSDLCQFLKSDFKWHVKKKDQINIESKLKTVRFIGELVKFKMFSKAEVLQCLKLLMFEFAHHNIEMTCALLDTCGLFLYRSVDSHHRTKVLLDIMMRKKAALHMDSRYSSMIENSYYYSNPPEVKVETKKVRPPLHNYIRKILYKDLSKLNVEKVLKQFRKLNWTDKEVSRYAVKCLSMIGKVRYTVIHCVANIISGLASFHENIAIQVVDNVLEDIRSGMEINHPKFNQRRICSVKFIGELYNYRMLESAVVFQTLYSLISFGVSLDENQESYLDPHEHLFRIRLVCVLLDTCGQYFDRGSSRKKLDCFITYFMRYYWFKKDLKIWTEECPFPKEIEHLVSEKIEAIRPKLKLPINKRIAYDNADALDKIFREKISTCLPENKDSELGSPCVDSYLSAIQETDEADDLNENLSQFQSAGDRQSLTQEESDIADSTDQGEATDSQSQNLRLTPHHEGDLEEQMISQDDVVESAGEDENEDHITFLKSNQPKLLKCTEDDDFMTKFDQMMAENVQGRIYEHLKTPQTEISIPVQLKGQTKKGVIDTDNNTINFMLITRRGNKQHFNNVNVPLELDFAADFKQREQAEKIEKEKMKRVVLEFHERQEEEDYQEQIAAFERPLNVNTNRERKVKYQHPRGAPDADLIFGRR